MSTRRGLLGRALLPLFVLGLAAGPAVGEDEPGVGQRLGRLFRGEAGAEGQAPTVVDLSNAIDRVGESIRDDGIVVIKQPDVWSNARLTKYRKEFEGQMAGELGKFQFILSARIGRIDAATTTSATSLGAALSPPGTTQVSVPAPPTIPAPAPAEQADFANSVFKGVAVGNNYGNLGLEPTTFLDEKRRFLEHLNEIRRIGAGPDQNDAAGYGLYLVRLPVSITPGERTYEGSGADLTLKVEHEFPPDFLASTFRNLVINDVVDQLGPLVYEVLRTGEPGGPSFRRLFAERDRLEAERKAKLGDLAALLLKALQRSGADRTITVAAVGFVVRPALRGHEPLIREAIADRVEALADAIDRVILLDPANARYYTGGRDACRSAVPQLRAGGLDPALEPELRQVVESFLYNVLLPILRDLRRPPPDADARLEILGAMLARFYETALPDDVNQLDDVVGLPPRDRALITRPLSAARAKLVEVRERLGQLNGKGIPSTRNPKQSYPIAPRDVLQVYLPETVLLLAEDARAALLTKVPRSDDVRGYLRQSLAAAFDAVSRPVDGPEPGGVPPLIDEELMGRLRAAVDSRGFAAGDGDFDALSRPSPLRSLRDEVVARLSTARANVANRPIGTLGWAICVDAVLLDAALREDIRRTFEAAGIPCEDSGLVRFYNPADPARLIFNDYVRLRWPIVTFALDPVTDQQNLADSFSLKRDLQLALSFAFATGQINFKQVSTFRRQLDQSSDTIALNRTVTGYAHGNDVFGFRFTPRFQNPPNQRTNLGVIASQLISGGPGPDYGTKHSKLEAGQRELTAILLVPTFLPALRMDVASNWFRLNDPEHPIVHTRRMVEQGRRVQELRRAVGTAVDARCYRADDLRVLQAKVDGLEAMLPQQSKVVTLPYTVNESGFELFQQGDAAMVPELSGFEGLDTWKPGTSSDVFLFGKYFSVHESRVIVGGVALGPTEFDIISREVMQVRLPGASLATLTLDGRRYIEVHVATPAGISNRALIPLPEDPDDRDRDREDRGTRRRSARLEPSTARIGVAYQWLQGAEADVSRLVPSQEIDPNDGILIRYEDPDGLSPTVLRVRFLAAIDPAGGRVVEVFLLASRTAAGPYKVNRRQLVTSLLERAQLGGAVAEGALLPAVVKVAVSVQPSGRDFVIDPVDVAIPLEIDFTYLATGADAPRGALPPAIPSALPSPNASFPPSDRSTRPASLPVSSPRPVAAPLLAAPSVPNILPRASAEATEVARMLLGSPASPPPSPSLAPASAPPVAASPTNVIVVPPPVDPKAKDKKHRFRLFGR